MLAKRNKRKDLEASSVAVQCNAVRLETNSIQRKDRHDMPKKLGVVHEADWERYQICAAANNNDFETKSFHSIPPVIARVIANLRIINACTELGGPNVTTWTLLLNGKQQV